MEPCFLLGPLQVHQATALRHHRVAVGRVPGLADVLLRTLGGLDVH